MDRMTTAVNNWLDYSGWTPPTWREQALCWVHRHMGVFKVGGIWFLRLGRLRFSFCVAKPRPTEVQ